jgi:hypothetical protein
MVNSLQVFEEHATMTTNNWLTRRPIRLCKNIILPRQPMLCSGTTIGPRHVMLEYLELMYREMKVWIADPQCRFNMNGDDQSIHNYLYYTGQFPAGTRSIPHRQGGIVNTVGHFAACLYHEHIAPQLALPQETSRMIQYPGAGAIHRVGWLDFSSGPSMGPIWLSVLAVAAPTRVDSRQCRAIQFPEWTGQDRRRIQPQSASLITVEIAILLRLVVFALVASHFQLPRLSRRYILASQGHLVAYVFRCRQCHWPRQQPGRWGANVQSVLVRLMWSTWSRAASF